jgi:hypothetical protein
MERKEAMLMVMDRARYSMYEHNTFTKTAGLPYSDDAIREALRVLSEPVPEGVPELVYAVTSEFGGMNCFDYAKPEDWRQPLYRYHYDGVVTAPADEKGETR